MKKSLNLMYGATLGEYAVILASILVIAVGTLVALGSGVLSSVTLGAIELLLAQG